MAEQDVISEYFDREFYLHRYPDIAKAQIDPLQHFCTNGWKEERDPTPWFSSSYYLDANSDIRAAGVNPFWHFLAHGRAEGRTPKPTVDARQDLLKYIQVPVESLDAPTISDEEMITEEALIEHLREKFEAADGIVLSFSHSCYPLVTAGTELFIADEQKLFNERRFVYLHFAPTVFSIFINDNSIEKTFTRMSLDGEVIGVSAFSAVVRALKTAAVTKLRRRLLVMHSPLGQSAVAFLRIFSTLEPTDALYWVHDYSSLCTGYNLLRNHVAFCHAPARDSVGCSICIFKSSRAENARYLQQMFRVANFTVVAPSASALDIWRKSSDLPHKATLVQEHCRVDYSAGEPRHRRDGDPLGSPGNPVRVAFVGYPVHHKGWPVFERLVEETWADKTYSFYHFSQVDGAFRSNRIHHVDAAVSSGRRDAMVELLCEHDIDIVTILAPWPETFSYVTFEALAAGCDIVTLADSGNVAAVIQQTGRGRIFPNEDGILDFFHSHEAVDLVRSRAEHANLRGQLRHCGTSAAIVFENTH
jgi:glycosyltransferase involved in cell wall biosynthesis